MRICQVDSHSAAVDLQSAKSKRAKQFGKLAGVNNLSENYCIRAMAMDGYDFRLSFDIESPLIE